MIDLIDELNAVHRETGKRTIPAGDGRTVVLRRTYDAAIDDVWNAITTKERIDRWLTPITGDLELGGRYQLEGNAGGEIVACEPPHLLRVTWVYGEAPTDRDISVVEVRLAPDGEDRTVLELDHAAVVDDEFWARYGPGAVGVGWDLALLGLANHLAGSVFDRDGWDATPGARDFMTRSSEAWGRALIAAGTPEDVANEMRDNTTAFYVPDEEG